MDARGLPRGPGKTVPRWITDLLDYDIRYHRKDRKNLLIDPAPQFRGEHIQRKGLKDCHHELARKDAQTFAPKSDDELPDQETKYVIAAYCAKCRYHFKVTVSFSPWKGGQLTCGYSDATNPLHHLRLEKSYQSNSQEDSGELSKYGNIIEERHRFSCSGSRCPMAVEIEISPARLDVKRLDLMLNPTTIQARGETEIKNDPERLGNEEPVPRGVALSYLRAYLNDARAMKTNRIATRNKKYRLAFADDCNALFSFLDFRPEQDPAEPDEEPAQFWRLPVITNTNRNFIDDIYTELNFLLEAVPSSDLKKANVIMHRPISAMKDLQRSLGSWNYPRRSRTIDVEGEEHPHYASLGALDDFTDELLSWAWDRQCELDPENKPYYLDCLEDLAKGRKSSDLETKVVMATSAGEYGLTAIEEAYNFFRLDMNSWEGDDHAIGVYRSRIESAPRQKDEARHCLLVIAKHRGSDKIEAQANDRSMTLEEALEFLSVTRDTDSDSIGAAAVAVALDADKGRVAHALRVISNSRNGDYILQKAAANIETGTESSLDVIDAYRRLQISAVNTSDENVFAYYKSLTSGAAPGSKDSYSEALRVIALDRDSKFLLRKIDDPDADVQASTAEPVGLDNIGNTCYLNSLLQYYYTVKPIRDMVMDYQNHRMELSEVNIQKKKVGGRRVEKSEIIKASKFVDELHSLFMNLKTASTRSVKPTKELAELTIFSSEAVKNYRSYSISSPHGPPNLLETAASPVYGPDLPPPLLPSISEPLHSKDDDIEMVDLPNNKPLDQRDDSSEATLVDELPSYDAVKAGNEDLRLLDAEKATLTQEPEVNVVEVEGDTVMVNGAHSKALSGDSLPSLETKTDKPPPVPPRNKAGLVIQTSDRKEIPPEDDLWRFGSQQDVTEVIGNVMFRLQCAIKPTDFEAGSGEQIDVIRTTFFGSNAIYTQKARSLEKKVEAWPTIIVFPAKDTTRDIYEALDVVYDEQLVEVDKAMIPQYSSISNLPPILQIQIQRTDYDPIRKASWKNRQPVTFLETLYLDRYVDSKDPNSMLMRRRRETWKWKRQLRILEARYAVLQNKEAEINVPDALIATQDFVKNLQEQEIDGLDIDPTLPDMLEERIAEVAAELETIRSQIEMLKTNIRNQFMDMRDYEYKLHAVFIHRGETGGGHYWIYIYDAEHDTWREYNDDRVEEVRDRKRIFESNLSNYNGTPYYLVYVRSADLKNVVDPVSREVAEVQNVQLATDGWSEQMHDDYQMVNTIDEEAASARHIEHAKPRPIRPKPVAQDPISNGWDDTYVAPSHEPDGNPW